MTRFSNRILFVSCTSLLLLLPLFAQDHPSKHDSTMVFGSLTPHRAQMQDAQLNNSWGVDLLLSTNGFGMGAFYRHEYADDLAGYIDFSISEAKDDNEVEEIDPYTYQSYVPNKINRFMLMPLFVGVQKRLFKDDIVDNFRPYVNAAAGPTMIYVFPYDQEYISALGSGSPRYTVGGYVGFGAFFGSERSSFFGINIRYYYVPYASGIASMLSGPNTTLKTQFGGFYITFNFGSAW